MSETFINRLKKRLLIPILVMSVILSQIAPTIVRAANDPDKVINDLLNLIEAEQIRSNEFINLKEASIKVNGKIELSLSGAGKEGLMEWKSSNADVAIVDSNGNVTGLKVGKATITGEYIHPKGGRKGTCVVTVKKETESKPLQKLIDTIKKNSGSNKKDSLVGNFKYVTSYTVVDINKDGTDELIILEEDKKLLIIIAIKNGKAVKAGEIKCSNANKYYINSYCNTIVYIDVSFLGSDYSSWYLKDGKLKTYNDRTLSDYPNYEGEVVEYLIGEEKGDEWSFVQEQKGEMVRISEKKYNEMVNQYYYNNDLSKLSFTEFISLNKKAINMTAGESTTLKLIGTSKKAKWSISDKDVAAVNQQGKVTALSEGRVTVRATIGNKSYECDVNVANPYLSNITYKYDVYRKGFHKMGLLDQWNLRMIAPKDWIVDDQGRNPDKQRDMTVSLYPKDIALNSYIELYMVYWGKYDFDTFKEEISKVDFSKEALHKILIDKVSPTAEIISYKASEYETDYHKFYKVEYEYAVTVNGERHTYKETLYDTIVGNFRMSVGAGDYKETMKPKFDTVLSDFINTLWSSGFFLDSWKNYSY